MDEAGLFHKVSRIDDSRLVELFAREVLASLVHKELLSPEWAERLLSWRHTGFNVHSLVRAKTKTEAERVGKYIIRPLLSLERLSFDELQVVHPLYLFVNREFVKNEWSGYKYINREQDIGLAGLRRAKMSYHPHHMVKKYDIRG